MIPPIGDDPTGDYLRKSVAVLGRGLAWLLFFGPIAAMSRIWDRLERRPSARTPRILREVRRK